jgi:hypothetical protein
MIRLYLFAEGPTEQTFARDVLKPHLVNFGVILHQPIRIAIAKKKGKVQRGGVGASYLPVKNDIQRFLAQEISSEVRFTTMIDLYAIHSDFPGLNKASKITHLPYERVKALENAFAEDIADRRFIPYLQLHEYEAFLFSDPDKFADYYYRNKTEISRLKAIADKVSSPELINDGPHTAPSKRIIEQFPDYKGAKSILGPLISEAIGLETIRSKCPHFNTWLSTLEQLDTMAHLSGL